MQNDNKKCLGSGLLDEYGDENPRECGDEGDVCGACALDEQKYWFAIFEAQPKCLYCGGKHIDHVTDECADSLMAMVEAGR